jgi:hypothetical protein
MASYARDKLAKLEEAAARHERLARSYGCTAPLKRPQQDAGSGDKAAPTQNRSRPGPRL